MLLNNGLINNFCKTVEKQVLSSYIKRNMGFSLDITSIYETLTHSEGKWANPLAYRK